MRKHSSIVRNKLSAALLGATVTVGMFTVPTVGVANARMWPSCDAITHEQFKYMAGFDYYSVRKISDFCVYETSGGSVNVRIHHGTGWGGDTEAREQGGSCVGQHSEGGKYLVVITQNCDITKRIMRNMNSAPK